MPACLSSLRVVSFLRVLSVSLFLASALSGPASAQSSTLPPANVEGVGQALVRQAGLEGRVLWMDGTANLQRLSTPAGVAAILDHCVKAHVNTVVVDVKPLSGH